MAHNVSAQIDGDKLVIVIDLSAAAVNSAPLSSTGKTRLIATTSGNVKLPCPHAKDLSYSVNVTDKR